PARGLAGRAAVDSDRESRSSGGSAARPAATILPARKSQASTPVGALFPVASRSAEFSRGLERGRRLATKVFRHPCFHGVDAADAVEAAAVDRYSERDSRRRAQPRGGPGAQARAREAVALVAVTVH